MTQQELQHLLVAVTARHVQGALVTGVEAVYLHSVLNQHLIKHVTT